MRQKRCRVLIGKKCPFYVLCTWLEEGVMVAGLGLLVVWALELNGLVRYVS